MNRSSLLLLLGLVVLISGFVKAAQMVKETRDAEARMAGKINRLATLQDLQNNGSQLGPADLERVGLDKPDALRRLVGVYLDGHTTSVKDAKREPMENGWEKHSAVLDVTNVPWAVLAKFLEKAGNHRHPWRVAAYELAPGDGGGSGTLTFETIVRKR